MVGSEPIDSLDSYRPAAKKYEVSLTFSGDAGHDIEELMVTMAVATPNEVVLRAIALLISARGKEVILRDPRTGVVEVIDV